MTKTWLTGPALDITRTLPDASVDLVATSPPFLALRDYNGVEGQWGSEPTPAAFLDNLLALAVELRRVLAPHGSLAFELGDTYAGSGGAGGDYNPGAIRDGQRPFHGSKRQAATGTEYTIESGGKEARVRGAGHKSGIRNLNGKRQGGGTGWPPAKSLTGTPTLFAWSLAYGRNLLNPAHEFDPWLVRNVIVWARNNPPVGALGDKVRPATSYITVACPSPKRWFDLDAVRTPHRYPASVNRPWQSQADTRSRNDDGDEHGGANPAGAPPLDHWHDQYDGDHTWLINTQGSSLAHYAMWPARLAERLVLSMCPREVCRDCGEPRRRLTERTYTGTTTRNAAAKACRSVADGVSSGHHALAEVNPVTSIETLGWSDCGHGNYRHGVTLDPFSGTGTTVHAAEVHGRDGIGIDLDPINATLRDRRRDEVRRNLLAVQPEIPGQLDLLEHA